MIFPSLTIVFRHLTLYYMNNDVIVSGKWAVHQVNQGNYATKRVQWKHESFLQPFEIYVLCDSLKTELGNALVDTVALHYMCSLISFQQALILWNEYWLHNPQKRIKVRFWHTRKVLKQNVFVEFQIPYYGISTF